MGRSYGRRTGYARKPDGEWIRVRITGGAGAVHGVPCLVVVPFNGGDEMQVPPWDTCRTKANIANQEAAREARISNAMATRHARGRND
jgi:hypothetical protein